MHNAQPSYSLDSAKPMRRREFITLMGGGAAAALPLAARAQQPAKVPRVGILSPAANETGGTLTAFREGIRDLGYVEGQTITLEFRLSKGITDSLPALATELVRIPVNVIVTDGTSATLAAFAATTHYPHRDGNNGRGSCCPRAGEQPLAAGRQRDWHTIFRRSERKAAAITQASVSRHRARRRFGKSKR